MGLIGLLVLSREWMGMGVAGIVINNYFGSFPHSILSTSKLDALVLFWGGEPPGLQFFFAKYCRGEWGAHVCPRFAHVFAHASSGFAHALGEVFIC